MSDNVSFLEPVAELSSTQEVSALELQERAQIDIQIATARRYPRVLSKVKQDMLSFATLDEDTASACFYTLPRGGKTIQGPSVRLAEIAISCYGNLRAGSRVISTETTGPNPHVVIQAVAHDLEKNVAITVEKRRRITKKKSKDAIDEDDINLACNAGAAIALRDSVFKIVPLALIKPVYDQAKKVATGDASTLAVKRSKMIDRLKQFGIDEARILAAVDARKVDDITLDKLETLIGLGTAIKEGEAKIDDAFPPIQKAPEAPKFTTQVTPPAVAQQNQAPVDRPAVSTEGATVDKPATQKPADALPLEPQESAVEKLLRLASVDGIPHDAVEAWAAKNKLSVTKEADAQRMCNAWTSIKRTLAPRKENREPEQF